MSLSALQYTVSTVWVCTKWGYLSLNTLELWIFWKYDFTCWFISTVSHFKLELARAELWVPGVSPPPFTCRPTVAFPSWLLRGFWCGKHFPIHTSSTFAFWVLKRVDCFIKWNISSFKFSQRNLFGKRDLERLLWLRWVCFRCAQSMRVSPHLWAWFLCLIPFPWQCNVLLYFTGILWVQYSDCSFELAKNVYSWLLWQKLSVCLDLWDLVCDLGCFRVPEVGHGLCNTSSLLQTCAH